MQVKRLLLMIGLLCGAAAGQTTSTITGTIKDLSQLIVTSGKVTFTLRPSTDATISGLARFSAQTVTCGINASGQVMNQALSGACVITMNTALQPPGSGYLVSFWPYNVKTATIFMYAIASSIDITTVVSTQSQLPNQGGVVDTFTNQTIGGNKTFTGVTSLTGGVALTSPTSTGTDNGSETLVNKTLTAPTLTGPTSTGADAGTETLSNKTLNAPIIAGATGSTQCLQVNTNGVPSGSGNPCGSMPQYANGGTFQNNVTHWVNGTVVLVAGAGSLAISGAAQYTNTPLCWTQDLTTPTNASANTGFSGPNSVTVAGTGTDHLFVICVGS
jgi:hypothetical protein